LRDRLIHLDRHAPQKRTLVSFATVMRELGEGSLLRELISTIPMGAALFDRDMRYLVHNAEWLVVHGEPADRDLVAKLHYDVFPIRDEWRDVHRRCLEGAIEDHHADRFDTSDGRREFLRWRVAPWRNAAREVGGVVIYAERLTESVRLRRTVSEQENLISALFEQSPVGLNLCTLDGVWLRSNPSFLSIIGYTEEEATGLTYWQLTPRRYDADEAAQLELLRTAGHYGPYEKEFIRKDGHLVPVRLTGFLVEREGVSYIWSLIEDLTAQRALETRLEEEQIKAIHTSKLATMGEMAAGFAHEINNPLGIIDAYAYTLAGAVQDNDAAHVEEALTAIRSATARAGAIVHGLRRFARERDDETDVPVSGFVEDALTLCRARIRTHDVALETDVQTTATVRGHAIELAQVLVNLLNNACDAVRDMPDGWIQLTARDRGDVVEIRVTDSGPGIPDDVDVFRAFFTTKPVGGGTGLGLSISRAIVERHRGQLTLERRAPTTFLVELPK